MVQWEFQVQLSCFQKNTTKLHIQICVQVMTNWFSRRKHSMSLLKSSSQKFLLSVTHFFIMLLKRSWIVQMIFPSTFMNLLRKTRVWSLRIVKPLFLVLHVTQLWILSFRTCTIIITTHNVIYLIGYMMLVLIKVSQQWDTVIN